MAISWVDIEVEMSVRMGDVIATYGGDDVYTSPIRRALRALSLTVSDPVADADLAAITTANEESFFDLVQYYITSNIHSRLTVVDWTAGPRSERGSQLADRMKKSIDELRDKIKNEHGIALGATKSASFTVHSFRTTT